ncbi:endonuclease/exonuclease/phosphatase family protein [Nonomuraea cypriaca]|uniref:endonuclease/exonuclease/phosphatase family protein n=1 Tax=Nonomuraea cypriaca TaxID=1187855 RepID=UPI001A9C97A2|nr:endonuclease/exonuclease/phosphatase family protein [Nonomuraea cypriaca]
MRRSSVTAALVVAALGAVLTAPPALADVNGREVRLRVASYNIHAGAGQDGRFDLARQADAIRALNADVIALQEVDVRWDARSEWRDLAAELARALRMQVYFGPIYDLDPPGEGEPRRRYGNAILSRYPILDAENHSITRLSTQTPNPVPEPAPGFPEIVVNAKGARLHVYATHLDYREDPKVRQMQVADTLKIMREDRDERILLGDFNARPDAPELAPLWGELTDVMVGEPEMTYPADAPDRRIDYVAVSRSVRVAPRTSRVPRPRTTFLSWPTSRSGGAGDAPQAPCWWRRPSWRSAPASRGGTSP